MSVKTTQSSSSTVECSMLVDSLEKDDCLVPDSRLQMPVNTTHYSSPPESSMLVNSLKTVDSLVLDSELEMPPSQKETGSMILLDRMLKHLAENQTVQFKSQQVGDPDLDFTQKREIAKDLLMHNPAQFLAKFGQYLLEEHLDYFTSSGDESQSYEVDFHVKRLRRYFCKPKNKVDVRNRRYEALKKLVEEGVYFSEEEMKKRNPLMYEQMIGQYLTSEEKEEVRKRERKKNERSYVMHLMDQIEEHYVNCLKKRQMDDEDGEEEKMAVNGEDELEEEEEEEGDDGLSDVIFRVDDDIEEFDTDSETEDTVAEKDSLSQCVVKRRKIDMEEKVLLREEFTNNMYESFLEGRDTDFDYSNVDSNPEYESTVLRGYDEEEKYFDSETPELVCSEEEEEKEGGNAAAGASAKVDTEEEEEEDELDKYMRTLQTDEEELAKCMENLKPEEKI